MKKLMLPGVCFAFLLMSSVSATAQAGQAQVRKTDAPSESWQLQETKSGVSCYSKTAAMGTGQGMYLRFVNGSMQTVTIDWTVSHDGRSSSGKLTLAPGETAEQGKQANDSAPLAVRFSSGQGNVSFTVSK